MNTLQKKIEEYKSTQKELTAMKHGIVEVAKYLYQDKDISLEERWNVWQDLHNLTFYDSQFLHTDLSSEIVVWIVDNKISLDDVFIYDSDNKTSDIVWLVKDLPKVDVDELKELILETECYSYHQK